MYLITGGSLLGYRDCFQYPSLPASPARAGRSDQRYPRDHLCPTGELQTEPTLCQLYRNHLQCLISAPTVEGAPVRDLAQRALVHKPGVQPRIGYDWNHRQAVA